MADYSSKGVVALHVSPHCTELPPPDASAKFSLKHTVLSKLFNCVSGNEMFFYAFLWELVL